MVPRVDSGFSDNLTKGSIGSIAWQQRTSIGTPIANPIFVMRLLWRFVIVNNPPVVHFPPSSRLTHVPPAKPVRIANASGWS